MKEALIITAGVLGLMVLMHGLGFLLVSLFVWLGSLTSLWAFSWFLSFQVYVVLWLVKITLSVLGLTRGAK